MCNFRTVVKSEIGEFRIDQKMNKKKIKKPTHEVLFLKELVLIHKLSLSKREGPLL